MIHLLVTKPGWGIAGHCQDLQEPSAAAPATVYRLCWETKQNKSNRPVVDTILLCAPGKRFRMGGLRVVEGTKTTNKQTGFSLALSAVKLLKLLTHELMEVVY